MLLLYGHTRAALANARRVIGCFLDIILHIGAHRTGTTSFQHMLRETTPELRDFGVHVWEPSQIRDGRFAGLIRPRDQVTESSQQKALKSLTGIQFELDRLDSAGVKALIISEENMLGQMKFNLATHSLYPDARFRLAQFARVFGERVSRVVMSIRAQDAVWRSTLAFGLNAGHDLVAGTDFDELSRSNRRWRHVIGDAQRAFPSAKMVVWQFEALRGAAQTQLAATLGITLPWQTTQTKPHHNASPTAQQLHRVAMNRGLWRLAKLIPNDADVWQPFTSGQRSDFQAAYVRDLVWLQKQPRSALEFYDNKNGVCAQTNPDGGRYDNQGRQKLG